MKKQFILLTLAGLQLLLGPGCISSSKIHQEASAGQQLMDLKKSLEEGIINEKEFERLKKGVMKRNR